MTTEEAIKFLYFSKDHWEEASPVAEAHKLAIKALEKQIPKKPVDGYICSCCGCDVTNQADNDYLFEHCYHCGQAIDWR